jgi:hypothetical protein
MPFRSVLSNCGNRGAANPDSGDLGVLLRDLCDQRDQRRLLDDAKMLALGAFGAMLGMTSEPRHR